MPANVRAVGKNGPAVWLALADGERTRAEIDSLTGLTARQVGYALTQLRRAGLVAVDGMAGRHSTRYRQT